MKLEPMLASAKRRIFDDSEWSYELKYAGFRALLVRDESATRFIGKRGSDFSTRLGALQEIAKSIKARSIVLDGEIIADDGDVESFLDLHRLYAMAGVTSARAKGRAKIKYVAFDALLINGRWIISKPLSERRAELRKLIPKATGALLRPKEVTGRGSELFAQAQSRGFEGVVAKRLDSPYVFGKRSKDWLRIEVISSGEEPALARRLVKPR